MRNLFNLAAPASAVAWSWTVLVISSDRSSEELGWRNSLEQSQNLITLQPWWKVISETLQIWRKGLEQSQNLKTLEPWQKVISETLQTCKFIKKWNGLVRKPRKAHRNWEYWAIVNIISELGHLEILPKLDKNDAMGKNEVHWVLDTACCHGLEGIIIFPKHINNLLLHAVPALREHLLKTQVAGPL